MANAAISKVSLANTANGPRIVLNLSNGDAQWYPQSYIEKLLVANFMGGMRPTVLIGTEVEYTKQSYKIGDTVTDENGVAISPAKAHTKDGVKLLNFTFGEIVGNITKLDEAQIMANAVAKASVKVAGLFGNKPKAVVNEDNDTVVKPVPELTNGSI